MTNQTNRDDSNGILLDPIYIQTSYGEDFELNWPIWHRLPHNERKSIANQHGFANIGDFEESVILTQTLRQGENGDFVRDIASSAGDESTLRSSYNLNDNVDHLAAQFQHKTSLSTNKNKNISNMVMEASSSDEDEDVVLRNNKVTSLNNTFPVTEQDTQNIESSRQPTGESETLSDANYSSSNGGLMMILPEDLILHHIMIFLSTEHYALCSLVSPHWKYFTRTESAYHEICKRCYLNQSKRKTLHVARFGGSYRTMLEKRWRVKVGCGVYVLKCTKIKQIQRDMWTEIPIGAILESTYYRYLYFYEDGRVLYSLTSKAPHEMIPTFRRMNAARDPSAVISGPGHSSLVYGSYEIQKDHVVINVRHPWHYVRMHLKVMEEGYAGPGRFWELKVEKHMSSVKNDFDEYWSRDLVEYNVPDEHFRFLRDWKL